MLWNLLLAYLANVGGVSFSVVSVACFMVVGGALGLGKDLLWGKPYTLQNNKFDKIKSYTLHAQHYRFSKTTTPP